MKQALIPKRTVFFLFLSVYPRRLGSDFIAFLVSLRRPAWLLRLSIRIFARHFKVALDEMKLPIESYSTFQEFFSRELKSGIRPLGAGLISPVDGELRSVEIHQDETLLIVKGQEYSASELLVPFARANYGQEKSGFKASWVSYNFYLSPRDYHRIHVPTDMVIERYAIFAGDVLPVNEVTLEIFPKVFVKNTRWIFEFSSEDFGQGYLIAVAALHVGGFDSPFIEGAELPERGEWFSRNLNVKASKGQLLGSFLMGSSVILCVPGEKFLRTPGPVKVGEAI